VPKFLCKGKGHGGIEKMEKNSAGRPKERGDAFVSQATRWEEAGGYDLAGQKRFPGAGGGGGEGGPPIPRGEKRRFYGPDRISVGDLCFFFREKSISSFPLRGGANLFRSVGKGKGP